MDHSMLPRAVKQTVTVDGPLYLAGLLARMKEEGAQIELVEEGGQVPLFFSRKYHFENVPRSRDDLFAWLATYASQVCDITTESTHNEGDSFSGVTIYRDTTAHALYRYQWTCPGYCDDECDAYGRFEAVWTLTPELEAGTLEPILKDWLLMIAVEVAQPIRQLLLANNLFAPHVGTAVGEAIRNSFSREVLPTIQADLIHELTKAPEAL